MASKLLHTPLGFEAVSYSVAVAWKPKHELRVGMQLIGTGLEPIDWMTGCDLQDVDQRVALYCDFHDWTKSGLIQVDSMVMDLANLQATLF